MSRLILIDGHNWLLRALHAIPEMRTSFDEPVHAAYGFVRTLLRILAEPELQAESIAVVWDAPGGKAARQVIDPTYKAARPSDRGPGFTEQLTRARQFTEALGVASVEVEATEADDVIGTLARHAEEVGMEVVVVSTDKDFRQLLGPCVRLYNAQSSPPQGGRWMTADRCAVPPQRFADYLALCGDASDGIEGVRGIGEVTARELLGAHLSLGGVISWAAGEVAEAAIHSRKPARHAAAIVEARERLARNLRLTRLWDIPAAPAIEALRRRPLDEARWVQLLAELEFKSLLEEHHRERRAA